MLGKSSRRVRTYAVGVIAGVALSAVSLTVAVPSAYAETLTDDLRSYQLRVPSSVIDDTTLTPDEKTAFRDLTRNNGRPLTVPMGGGTKYSRPGGGTAISGLLGVLLSFAGDQGWIEVKKDPQLAASNDARVEDSRAQQCATLAKSQSANPDWFMPSWLAQSNEWLYRLIGHAPCTQKLEVDPNYVPLTQKVPPAGVTNYPFNMVATGGQTLRSGTPYWSNAVVRRTGYDAAGKMIEGSGAEGWVVPVKAIFPAGAASTYINFYTTNINPDGSYFGSNNRMTSGGVGALTKSVAPSEECKTGGFSCITLSPIGGTQRYDLPQSLLKVIIYSTNTQTQTFSVSGLPYGDVFAQATPPVYRSVGVYPLQEFVTTITDTKGNVYSCKSATFRESEAFVAKPCSPTIPSWAIPLREEVTQGAPGAPPAEMVPIRQTETSPEYREWRTAYPGCDVQTCLLDLSLADGRSCFDMAEECDGWFIDPNKATKYGCTYHGVPVVLAKCADYARTFNLENRQSGTAYPDKSGATPGAGSSSTPGTAVAPFQDQTPEARGQCFPRGWAAFNPLEWVLKPVGCALHTAFVPRQSVVKAGNQRLVTAVSGSALGGMSNVVKVLGESAINGGGCGGIPWKFKVYTLEVNTSLLNSCPGSNLHGTSVIIRGVLAASLSTIAVLSWVRYLGMIFGYGSFGRGPEGGRMESVSEINAGTLVPDNRREIEAGHRREIGQ